VRLTPQEHRRSPTGRIAGVFQVDRNAVVEQILTRHGPDVLDDGRLKNSSYIARP
jgi:hypothetical protein